MIAETKIYKCRKCGSERITKNGKNKSGNQQYYCRDCRVFGVLEPKVKYTEEKKEEIIRAYQERSSMRGIQRIYGVSRGALSKWLKKSPKFARPQRSYNASSRG